MKRTGSRQEVWDCQAHHTRGGLTKADLTMGSRNAIVSKKRAAAAVARFHGGIIDVDAAAGAAAPRGGRGGASLEAAPLGKGVDHRGMHGKGFLSGLLGAFGMGVGGRAGNGLSEHEINADGRPAKMSGGQLRTVKRYWKRFDKIAHGTAAERHAALSNPPEAFMVALADLIRLAQAVKAPVDSGSPHAAKLLSKCACAGMENMKGGGGFDDFLSGFSAPLKLASSLFL